jgi:predicted alpha/beta superfamily hydrolase
MSRFIIFIALNLFAILQAKANMTITVIAPNTTPISDVLYIAGDFNTWNPSAAAYTAAPIGNFRYTISIPPPTNTAMLFKFTRGSWTTVECMPSGADIANRTMTYQEGGSATFTIENWKDLGGTTHSLSGNCGVLIANFSMPQLNTTRRIWLYLPPDYTTNTAQRYPVLYMHDAQNLFDVATAFSGEWGIDEAMQAMTCAPRAIVVGIDNGGSTRLNEYSPWVHPTYGGGQGAAYMNFIVQNLKPYIDANYRTKSDVTNTGIMGSSMGGLISFYGAMQHQNVFGKAGVFSPSFWFSNQIIPFVQQTGKQGNGKFYFMCGQNEDADMVPDMNGVYSAMQNLGFQTNTHLTKVVKSDGQHSEWFWKREFPAAYCWLFSDLVATENTANRSAASDLFEIKAFANAIHIAVLKPETPQNTLITVSDSTGKTVFITKTVLADAFQIDTTAFAKGVYLVEIRTENSVFTKKVIL